MIQMLEDLTHSRQAVYALGSAILFALLLPLAFTLLSRMEWRRGRASLRAFFSKERWSLPLAFSLSWVRATFPFGDVDGGIGLHRTVTVALVAAATWSALGLVGVLREAVDAKFPIDKKDNLQERKVRTQFLYIRSVLYALIVIVGTALVLWQFEGLRTIGVGLLASAGLGAVVLAFAAQETLSNLLAGFQIAFTQPFRIDDVVIVEGEWGRIEEITLTYVVVRIWDQRRLVLPITYFTTHPFQNWTRTSAEIWGTVVLYVDYTVPVDRVREELERIVRSTPLWDGKVVGLQVTDATDRAIALRALVSAKDASDAWDLRCLVRERLIAFLQREFPDALPRLRVGTRALDPAPARKKH